MHFTKSLLLILPFCLCHCSEKETVTSGRLGADLFQHHYVVADLPGDSDWGYGTPVMADFDKDGDPDYGFCVLEDSLYWFENRGVSDWLRHSAGPMPLRTLGANVIDVDDDGWTDMVIGGYWYRNPGNPRSAPFELYCFDDRIQREIHDIVVADVSGDGHPDVVATGDHEGMFWYQVPARPKATGKIS